jgi:Tol biopolymer transport system component
MPNFDDLLTRELERAGRPAAPDLGRVEKEVRRRRARRGVVRRFQAGALTVAVLAATAGGFLVLEDAFRGGGTIPAQGPLNGDIVFVREAGHPFEVLVAPIDGSSPRVLVADGFEPAVSPDGTQVAMILGGERARTLAVVPLAGGEPRAITPDRVGAVDPSWSPDGSLIAYVRFGHEESRIWTVRPDGSRDQSLDIRGFADIVSPTWSPDGERLAFSASRSPENPLPTWDLFMYDLASEELKNLTTSPEIGETSVAWSPDGSTLAFERRQGDGPGEIWTMTPEGSGARRLATGDPTLFGPTWAPDGTALLASDGDSVLYVDPNSGSLTKLFAGREPSWQPLPDASLAPEPSEEPSSEGRDIGLDFRICNVETLGGIDFIGGGPAGRAWTGVPVTGDGSCPQSSFGKVIVAVDHTGDGLADSWWGPIEGCDFCRPLGATDLDVDGIDEIVVQNGFSIADHWIFRVPLDEGAAPQVEPILVAPPGHEPAGLPSGEPLVLGVGGDAGYSGYLRCETYPESPVLVYTWIFAEVDANTDQEVHETRLNLGDDGMFHVVDTNDFKVPRGNDIPLELSRARACGVDWDLFA